ncbi:DUF5050 domain-containing protein [Bacillus alkalicola]|uniref:DUF5050 domain-containing protein n=2 Tax=Bacillaceae TaxID=186817 RepID=A0ABS6JNY7_9BACI|nr:DUF5050 domain-containing protein [Bacillus alkalicola]MBU9720278.1 DUF5050 domain-containing protein [Bacillus alkalicola]
MIGSMLFVAGCADAIKELRGLLGDLEQLAEEDEQENETSNVASPEPETETEVEMDVEAEEEEASELESEEVNVEENGEEDTEQEGEAGYDPSNEAGNFSFVDDRGKSGNISTQGGLHDLVDNWVYFANREHNNYLYKIKMDGSGLTQLTDHAVRNINVLGDWIYYLELSNATDHIDIKSFNKITKDGSSIETIIPEANAVTQVHSSSDDIYFVYNNQITRMTQDGEMTTLPYLASDMSISEERIVYYGYDDVNDLEGYFLGDIHGTPGEMIHPEGNGYYTLVGNALFFTRGNGEEGLFKLNVDGGEPFIIIDDFIDYFNVDTSYVYYSTAESEATRENRRTDRNGNNNVKMSYVTNSINIFDNYIMGEFMRQGYYSLYFTNKRTGEITEIEVTQ